MGWVGGGGPPHHCSSHRLWMTILGWGGRSSSSSLLISPTLDDHFGVGWVGWGSSSSSLLISLYFVIVFLVGECGTQVQKKLTEFEIYPLLLYSCSKILVYMIISNRTINTQIWCLLLDQVCPMVVEWNLPFVIVFLVGEGGTQVQKKLTECEIYLLLLYSCSKILVYMIISNRTINTQIWCFLLDQVCPNEHHLPVPFPYRHCDRGGVGSRSSSSLLISPTLDDHLGVGWGSSSSTHQPN